MPYHYYYFVWANCDFFVQRAGVDRERFIRLLANISELFRLCHRAFTLCSSVQPRYVLGIKARKKETQRHRYADFFTIPKAAQKSVLFMNERRNPCRKIRSGRWSAQARNVGSQCWLSILDRWSIEAWMIITGLYWLVILAPKSLPMIGRESLPELSRRSFKFIKILIMTIKFKT